MEGDIHVVEHARRKRSDSLIASVWLFVLVCGHGAPAQTGYAADAPLANRKTEDAYVQHEQLFVEDKYPSATTCRNCHPNHYREWSVSQHAYAQLSPVFNAMQGTITKLTSGSNGDFCIRCHTQAGMNLGEPSFMSNLDRQPISREGITCVVCHRMNTSYGKISGRFALTTGDLLEPVYGPRGGAELKRVLSEPEIYQVVTNRTDTGRRIHTDARRFFQLTTPGFCGMCHDVTLMDGFRLEEAFSSFKNSPAAKRGETCQDCHMGTTPGRKSDYAFGPAAVVRGEATRPRKLTSHMFVGPDYSVVHPGLFPQNPKAMKLATIEEWLTFDHEAGWGTDEFESHLPEGIQFPPRWKKAEDRMYARKLLHGQFKLLEEAREQRLALLRTGYILGELRVKQADSKGLRFAVEFKNGTDGHNAPTGFDAERPVWLHVTVTDAAGKVVFQSGDLDPNGDLRDAHSAYVHHDKLPLDDQLFSLQSKFITRNHRGGDREQVLAVNYSIDPLPFVRPETFSSILTGRPGGARIQRRGIEPLGHRWADYKVSTRDLTAAPPYHINIKLMTAMVPANLIREIQGVGFDYHLSPRQVAEAIRAGHLTLWNKDVNVPMDGSRPVVNLAEDPDAASHADAE